MHQRLIRRLVPVLLVLLSVSAAHVAPAAASPTLVGAGSSFAGIEFQEWSKEFGQPPYNQFVNYQSSSSGQGRSNFTDKTVDFAVSDIRYNPPYDVNPPDPTTFEYIPVTAGGIAIMYNLKKHGFGLSGAPIHLSSLTVCGLFTAAIPYWDDPAIAADNPGVALPHVTVTPVVRSDPAGTNYVLEEYCLALQPDLYARYANRVTQLSGIAYPPNAPTSSWPIQTPVAGSSGSDGVADAVSGVNNDGFVTAVETGYATQRHFPVAAVKNDTGAYVLPGDKAVATALSFATQRTDGTHLLNFSPGSATAYNPSTYSYFLVRLSQSADKGAALTQFAEFCLTIGQSEASGLSYASIGRSLILYGLDRLTHIQGYVAPTADELAAIPAADAIPPAPSAPPQGSDTTPAPGATPGSPGSGTGGSPSGTSPSRTPSGAATPRGTSVRTGASATTSGARTGSSVAAAGLDASVSLDAGTGPLAQTGVESDVLAAAGSFLLLSGEVTRRLTRRRRGKR